MQSARELDASRYAPSITTLAAAARVTSDRYRRFTLFGRIPIIRWVAWPWIWPLLLAMVGARAGAIHHMPGASLEVSDGRRARAHLPSLLVAFFAFVILGMAVDLVADHMAGTVFPMWLEVTLSTGFVIPFLLLALGKMALNPQTVTVGHRRRQLAKQSGRPVLVLTSLVSRRAGTRAAISLGLLVQEAWRPNSIVIGYPATKSLIRYYVRWGARRDGLRGRRMILDYQEPRRLMTHTVHQVNDQSGEGVAS